jgi:DNA repair protein RadC
MNKTSENYITADPPVRTVKDFDPEDQPREKAMKYGVQSLATADLFALILRTGMQGIPVTDMCRNLMRSCDNKLLLLERRSMEEILEVQGIGKSKALQVLAVMELIRRYSSEKMGDRVQIVSADTVFDLMRTVNGNLPHEEMWVLYLDRQNKVIDKRRISSGSGTGTIFDIKSIIKQAIMLRAEGLVLCHNHPSGNKRPSPQDDSITHRLLEGCKTVDLRLLDHVIVTTDGYYSYSNESKLI